MLKKTVHIVTLCIFLSIISRNGYSQILIEDYKPLNPDSIRIGVGESDFMPFIQGGYTLMLPDDNELKGVLILLEDSGYDDKNKSAMQLYEEASLRDLAVLSISSEIPFDFYFSESSQLSTYHIIKEVFAKYKLPNENVFFLGASLVGHRAMRFIKFMKEGDHDFQLNIQGLVICNFTLDWTRKWQQHERDIRIDRISLWEPRFMNYMLETHLKGTPKNAPENYHDFSPYSYFDESNRNIVLYKNYAIRAYIEPAIKYRLTKYYRTLYENNATDIVGFLAELELAGNENTELIVIQPKDDHSDKKNAQSTWDSLDKKDLMDWIQKEMKN